MHGNKISQSLQWGQYTEVSELGSWEHSQSTVLWLGLQNYAQSEPLTGKGLQFKCKLRHVAALHIHIILTFSWCKGFLRGEGRHQPLCLMVLNVCVPAASLDNPPHRWEPCIKDTLPSSPLCGHSQSSPVPVTHQDVLYLYSLISQPVNYRHTLRIFISLEKVNLSRQSTKIQKTSLERGFCCVSDRQ